MREEMDGSMGMGFMAVFAVSGSVALLALQVHKRLLSDFMRRIEFEFGSEKCQHKKRVRFTNILGDTSSNFEKESSKTNIGKPCLKRSKKGLEDSMPLNRLALYRGIIKYRMLFPKKEYGVPNPKGINTPHVHY